MYDMYEDLKKTFSAIGFVLLIAGLLCRILFEFITIADGLLSISSIVAYCGFLLIATVGFGLVVDKIDVLVTYKYNRVLNKAIYWIFDSIVVLLCTLLLAYDFGFIINVDIISLLIVVVIVIATVCIGIQINKSIFKLLDKEIDEAQKEYAKRREQTTTGDNL